jgi:hypothetical protein
MPNNRPRNDWRFWWPVLFLREIVFRGWMKFCQIMNQLSKWVQRGGRNKERFNEFRSPGASKSLKIERLTRGSGRVIRRKHWLRYLESCALQDVLRSSCLKSKSVLRYSQIWALSQRQKSESSPTLRGKEWNPNLIIRVKVNLIRKLPITELLTGIRCLSDPSHTLKS